MTKIQPTLIGWYSATQAVESVRGIEQQPISPCPAPPHCRNPGKGADPDGTSPALWVSWRGDASATISTDVTADITAFLPETLWCRGQWSSQQCLQSVVILWKTSRISREDSHLDFWARRTYPLDLWLFRLHHSPVHNIKALWQIADVSMDSDLWLLPRENY